MHTALGIRGLLCTFTSIYTSPAIYHRINLSADVKLVFSNKNAFYEYFRDHDKLAYLLSSGIQSFVEYSYNMSGVTMTPKLWIWNEKGIPLRLEMKSSIMAVNISMILQYKNFLFAEIPDSTFNVTK